MSLIISLFLLDFKRVYPAVMKCISTLMFLLRNEMALIIELFTFFSYNIGFLMFIKILLNVHILFICSFARKICLEL
jgi:hypothetical protein